MKRSINNMTDVELFDIIGEKSIAPQYGETIFSIYDKAIKEYKSKYIALMYVFSFGLMIGKNLERKKVKCDKWDIKKF